jgi:hypothetical protein
MKQQKAGHIINASSVAGHKAKIMASIKGLRASETELISAATPGGVAKW